MEWFRVCGLGFKVWVGFRGLCVCVCVRVCARMCVCMCVYVKERERERECVFVCSTNRPVSRQRQRAPRARRTVPGPSTSLISWHWKRAKTLMHTQFRPFAGT